MKHETRRLTGMALMLLGAACVAAPEARAGEIGASHERLMGDVTFEDECSEELQTFNEKIASFGRVAAASRAFAECLDEAMRAGTSYAHSTRGTSAIGPYLECEDEPFEGQTLATQIQAAYAATHSPNDLLITCAGASGDYVAVAGGPGVYLHDEDEAFTWSGWLASVYDQLSRPAICTRAERADPDAADCRFAPYPWPYSQAAGAMWHEAMHTHGYSHGANDQRNARPACGYAGMTDAQWHFQVNTLPYIAGWCVSWTIDASADQCGDIDACGKHALHLIDGWGSSTCECVEDPRMNGLGVLGAGEDHRLEEHGMVYDGDAVGRWRFNANDALVGLADFDGDGLDELLMRSAWGLGIVRRTPTGAFDVLAASAYQRYLGSHYFTQTDVIEGIGDFDGDTRAEILIRGSRGIAVIDVGHGSGPDPYRLFSRLTVPYGSSLGSWVLDRSNTIEGIGNFDGDERDEFVIRSAWGLAFIRLDASGSLRHLALYPYGRALGKWSLGVADRIDGIGDVSGDRRADLVVRSRWGLGILQWTDGGFRSAAVHANGSTLGGWLLRDQDVVAGIGNFDGSGGDDLLVRSAWGLGQLRLSGTSLTAVTLARHGSSLGGWALDPLDEIVGVGRFRLGSRDQFVVRSGWGLGVIDRSSTGRLTAYYRHPHGDLLGSWLLGVEDRVVAVGNLTNDVVGDDLVDEIVMLRPR